MLKYKIHHDNLNEFLQELIDSNDSFTLLNGLCQWLRSAPKEDVVKRLRLLRNTLKYNRKLGQEIATLLCRWLCEKRLYPLFISSGLLAREGFGREMKSRIYERINPAFRDVNDLRDVFYLLFSDKNDVQWLNEVPLREWAILLKVLRCRTSQADLERLNTHLHHEGLFAVEMLSIWLAAEEMEPDLMRLEPSLLDADSPFVALKREVTHWVIARKQQQEFDDSHLQVMLDQSKVLIERLSKRSALSGSSLNVAYLLERLQQTLERLTELMTIFQSNRYLPRRLVLLTGKFAIAAADQHSISRLWKQSVKLLARSITQATSDHGEHYITRNKKEYFSMFYSAAGGGVLIALMALFKIYLGNHIEGEVWKGIASGLNYGIGFTIIFMLHFTVATKQPAMTASRFAEAVGKSSQGRAVNSKLAQLLVDVFRSQSIAVLGNVSIAMGLAAIISAIYAQQTGNNLLSEDMIDYQLHSIDPLAGTLWFAAIAGLWLFCSGIISGYFDNRCNYLNMRLRLREHPLLKSLLSTPKREKCADYIHDNYGSIMGNLCFGMLLGLTGMIGHLSGLPLDIRHVAFSSANIGYAAVSGDFDIGLLLQSICFVLVIGLVNLIVSFSLTLWIALRSLGAEIESWSAIRKAVWTLIKQNPLMLFFPVENEKTKV